MNDMKRAQTLEKQGEKENPSPGECPRRDGFVYSKMVEGMPTYHKTVSKPALLVTP